ncbi:MAG TPA: DUF2254 family protein, partial [Pyrinomonadaceae bacterium]|nr:DUF2254 family protein [Pyrinomonadaceae bacterium]
MSWLQRYRIRLYLRNSIWIFPALSIVAGLVAVRVLTYVDRTFGWELNISSETARTVMGTVAGSMFTLLVLVCSAVLVSVQLASGQLTPRLIALIYRNPFRKIALAVFAFTFSFSVGVLPRLEGAVPLLTVYVAAYGFLLNLAFFLLFIDGMGKTLRPSSVLRGVALMGREVIRAVYPQRLEEEHSAPPEPIECLEHQPDQIILTEGDGAVLAFDLRGLVSLAEGANCLIELVPEVGDYIAAGDPLLRIFQGG